MDQSAFLVQHELSAAEIMRTSDLIRPESFQDSTSPFVSEILRHDQASSTSQPAGILIEGAPGTGKTRAARYLAGQLKAADPATRCFRLSGDELDVETLNLMFSTLTALPGRAVLILDDLDSIAMANASTHHARAAMACLLRHLDGLTTRGTVVVVATTSSWIYDLSEALLRPGRLSERIYCFERHVFHLVVSAVIESMGILADDSVDPGYWSWNQTEMTMPFIRQVVSSAFGVALADGRDRLSQSDLREALGRVGVVDAPPAALSGERRQRILVRAAAELAVAVVTSGSDCVVQVMRSPKWPTYFVFTKPSEAGTIADEACPEATRFAAAVCEQKLFAGEFSLASQVDHVAATIQVSDRIKAALEQATGFMPIAGYHASMDLGDEARNEAVAVLRRRVDEAVERADRIVSVNLEAIQAFALILSEHESLHGEELQAAIASVGFQDPGPASPA